MGKFARRAFVLIFCFLSCMSNLVVAAKVPSDESSDIQRFLTLRDKLQTNIKDPEKLKIQFSLGEYYFKIKAFREAKVAFDEIIQQNKGGIPALLANVYLYHLGQIKGKSSESLLDLKKKIFADQFILLFDKYKTIQFTSPWGYDYEIHYFVDKIVVYRNGEVFEKITP